MKEEGALEVNVTQHIRVIFLRIRRHSGSHLHGVGNNEFECWIGNENSVYITMLSHFDLSLKLLMVILKLLIKIVLYC